MISFKAILGFLLASLVATIAILTVVCYQNNQDVVDASLLVRHSHQVIEKADDISSDYKDARLAINNIIIRRDTSMLAAYVAAMRGLSLRVRELRQLTRDNSSHQQHIDSLEPGLQQFQNVSDSLARLVKAKFPPETILAIFSGSRTLRDSVSLKIKAIKDAEKVLLAKRELANHESVAAFARTFIFLRIGMMILLGATFLVVRYNFNKRRKAEEKMKQALNSEIELNKLKSNFVTLASHEFRTPLTTILSSTFLLENYSSGEHQDKIRKHLARIKSSVNNLTSILDEFLSVTKIEEGQVQPVVEKIDLPGYIRTTCANLQGFAKPGQVIHYSHAGESEVNTDPVLLGNILSNLITNSIKYSAENSPVHVMSTVNSRVHLKVKDHGIGIPEADQKYLFQRFYRASNAGTVQGTGLGLHIMKHYVGMLNGSVTLRSEVGKGTEVEVSFDNGKSSD